MKRISFAEVQTSLERILFQNGFPVARARLCARLVTETHCDGIASHGLNRFPRFIRQVRCGYVRPEAEPVCIEGRASFEQWDGCLGPGNLNAWAATQRALEVASSQGTGCIGLRNTNHWMRGGTYGWQAASQGFGLIAWTNTMPLMPPWGGRERRLGNNPLVLAVPRGELPLVFDSAMSQFSLGKMEMLALRGERLPVPGGFDTDGRLTDQPQAILESGRPLPIGFWKGTSLALMLDLLSAALSGGQTTLQIGRLPEEHGVSQIFLAFDLRQAAAAERFRLLVEETIEGLQTAARDGSGNAIRYPGERVMQIREENLRLGLPVDEAVWSEIVALDQEGHPEIQE